MKSFPIYIQHDVNDCGPTCIRMVAKYNGKNVSLKTLRERSYSSRSGVSMLGISDAAESIGYRTLGARITYDQLVNEANLPCIAHWKQKHFVVIYKITKRLRIGSSTKASEWIHIADPAKGLIKYSSDDFKKYWIPTKKDGEEKGNCLFLETKPEFNNLDDDEIVNKGTITYLLGYLSIYKNLLLQLTFSFLISSIFSLLAPFLTQTMVDRGVNYKDISFLGLVLISQFALTIGSAVVNFIRSWIMLHLSTRINISLLSDFLSRLMKMPISYFDSKVTGDLLQRMNDNTRIQNFLTTTVISIVFSVVNFMVFAFILALYNVKILLFYVLGSGLYVLWITLFANYRRNIDNRMFTQLSNNQNNLIELVTGMPEIKMNNCEQRKRWEWQRIQAQVFKITTKGMLIGQFQSAGGLILTGLTNFTITYFSAKLVISGDMTLGMMLSVQYMIGQLSGPVESLIGFIKSLQDTKISLERLSEIQDDDAEDFNGKEKYSSLPDNRNITLEKISFQYSGPHSKLVLKNINLTIPANKVTAIVGTSGSGKTTLLKLLLGFYYPTEGKITIGSTPLTSILSKTWRKNAGTVLQDGFIFSDTIANNIAISDEVVDKEKLYNAAEMANIREFIESLPTGYNTKIGNSGNGVSQGQKQRLLIARAVYKDPQYLFFDEATNALDSNNELVIMNNLNIFFQGKTVLVVAHRLSTVKNADNIVVLEKGEIVEQGNHLTLIKDKGHYYNLVKNQLELGN
ncbi:peptidase domain-containing ABC transporter [Mucilaginibacter sp. UYCu711]|uniref:peptidase domain-containing ABC transporter n=1 Tax=Mucilaginibacter sp. UYCu711 TaxID=3156339 RepID=UPI003D1FCB3D